MRETRTARQPSASALLILLVRHYSPALGLSSERLKKCELECARRRDSLSLHRYYLRWHGSENCPDKERYIRGVLEITSDTPNTSTDSAAGCSKTLSMGCDDEQHKRSALVARRGRKLPIWGWFCHRSRSICAHHISVHSPPIHWRAPRPDEGRLTPLVVHRDAGLP